jgi:RNA polymerase sigma-70 factor (ECF subfamily)
VSQPAEAELLARARGGDPEAFRALVEPHLGMFQAVIHRILLDTQDTQDALQEALLTMHQQLGRFEEKSRFSTWGYRICVNEALMLRRSRGRRREDFLEDFLPRFRDEGHHMEVQVALDRGQQPEAHVMAEGQQLRAKVMEGLGRLSDDQRAVFVLKDLEDWNTEEIAAHLGISRELVRQRLHRARLGMRGLLQRFAKGRSA